MNELLTNWYKSQTKKQLYMLYILSTGAILFYGVGLIPLAILIYIRLGMADYKQEETQ